MGIKRGIVVSSLEDATSAFFSGKPVEEKAPTTIETIVSPPIHWMIPRSVHQRIRARIKIMDQYFPDLRGCEIGFMNVFDRKNQTKLDNILLFNQLVRPSVVSYSDESSDESYKEVEKESQTTGRELILGGITHIHPGGTKPSSLDKKKFEECTRDNIHYQDYFGWVDATKEFASISSDKSLRDVLESSDAAVVIDHGDPRVYIKVNYGYSLFLIYSRNSEMPWAGVGECKRYCFEQGKGSYRLLDESDGVRLTIIDDEEYFPDVDSIKTEIREKVKPLVLPKPKRPHVVPDSVITIPAVYQDPKIVGEIERNMPTTANELFSLLGDFLRFGGNGESYEAIRRVHEMFSGIYTEKGTFEDQYGAASKVLRSLSPNYDSAMKLKEQSKNDI